MRIFFALKNVEFCDYKPGFADTTDFVVPFEESASAAHRMLVQACGGYALGCTWCNVWFHKFKNGNFYVRNEGRGRTPKKFQQALLDEGNGQEMMVKQLYSTRKPFPYGR